MGGAAGLVVAGAGARGAYEAGAVAVLVRRMIADGHAPRILVGTSAGALNVVGLAGFAAEGLPAAADKMAELWSSVHFDQVADMPASVVDDGLRFTGQLLGVPTRMLSLLDTRRQRETLSALMPIDAVHDAVTSGPIDAVGVATTSAATGATVVFVEKKPTVPLPPYDPRRNISYVETRLTVEHVLASAAVPVAFRPVKVLEPAPYRGWYLDGGVRLNVPLKPAIQMGCDYLGVVSTHPRSWRPPPPAVCSDPPDVFHAASLSLQGLMADRMVEDLWTLAKVNRLVAAARTGSDDRRVEFLFAGPPPDKADAIGTLANTVFADEFAGLQGVRSPGVWLLSRLIGGAHRDHGDLLSFLFFESEFTSRAAPLGALHAAEVLVGTPRWLDA